MIKRPSKKKSLSVRASADALKKLTSGKKPKIRKSKEGKKIENNDKQQQATQTSLFEEDVVEQPEIKVEEEVAVIENIEETSEVVEQETIELEEIIEEVIVQNNEIDDIEAEIEEEVESEIDEDIDEDNDDYCSQEDEVMSETQEIELDSNDKPNNQNVFSIVKESKNEEEPKKPKLVSNNLKKGLHICNLGKSYGDKPAVRDISMVVNRGEAVGLLGPNGAGKTSSFYMVMGLIRPDYGTISLDGVDITNLPVYRRARMGIGYLPQEASIFRGMTVEENILSVLELSQPVSEKRAAELDALLGEFSITHLRRSPAVALSGGERRRVEIARALASNPSFILLDEPLAGIDPVAVADIKELISHLKNRGIGVLITDHNVREALDLINRAYIIHDGKVLMEGTPTEIVGNKEVRRVYLGDKFSL